VHLRDGVGYFRDYFVVSSVSQNDYRNFQHDALAAPLSVVVATAWRRDGAHIAKLSRAVLEICQSRMQPPLNHYCFV
jgi:hypothetical protein